MADHPPVPGREIASFTLRADTWVLYDEAEGDPNPEHIYLTGGDVGWGAGVLLPPVLEVAGVRLGWSDVGVISQLVAAYKDDLAPLPG